MLKERRKAKVINIGGVKIGGSECIAVQSMCNTLPNDIEGTIKQVKELKEAGCAIVRISVPDKSAVNTIFEVKKAVNIPIVADIHFDYKLAIEAVSAGADKIRINPGNIGDEDRIKAVAALCNSKNIPIRIGVNSGSLEKHILEKFKHPTPEAMAESAEYHISLLEKFDFNNIVISLKSSNVSDMIKAYRLLAEICDYPLHLGVTEAGTEKTGLIKSAMGIGALLLEGIGDTIRVSLTAPPVKEVYAGYEILRAAGLYNKGVEFISCPTCGRTGIDVIALVNELEEKLKNRKDLHIKVAVMGCIVNGPGEAKEADIGVAGGKGEGLIFKKGEILRKVPEEKIVEELIKEIENL